jgi:hypothetical protein
MFGDYKTYRKYAPKYSSWKKRRELEDSRREAYLRQNPQEIDPKDIQKGKTLLRAIDIMDEYSQKRAENMEVATEAVVGYGMEIALSIGSGLGYLVSKFSPVQNMFKKYAKDKKQLAMISGAAGIAGGALVGTVAAFPLFAWAAKTEVNASRKGRFEAMRKELNNPKTFAILTPEQELELQKTIVKSTTEKKKNSIKSIKESWNTLKNMATTTDEYYMQRMKFEKKLEEDSKNFNRKLTPEQIENAKKDQQLLTKLVEKIDIASQDYAENAELATMTLTSGILAFGALFNLGYSKLAQKMKWKMSAIPSILTFGAMLGISIFNTSIQKEASRVGRFKVKQELEKHPEQLVYVSDEKSGQITDVKIKKPEKTGMLNFLKHAWKNNKEYQKWKKTEGAKEKHTALALEKINITDEQMKDAQRLQHNTFKTFNKVDEKSQKYSESIEALGQAIEQPIGMILGLLGAGLGAKMLMKAVKSNKSIDQLVGMMEYTAVVILACLPSIGINAYITKEQKKASRVADMLAIKEMSDYRHFVGKE